MFESWRLETKEFLSHIKFAIYHLPCVVPGAAASVLIWILSVYGLIPGVGPVWSEVSSPIDSRVFVTMGIVLSIFTFVGFITFKPKLLNIPAVILGIEDIVIVVLLFIAGFPVVALMSLFIISSLLYSVWQVNIHA